MAPTKLKGLRKTLLFSILPRKKDASMRNCMSIVVMVFECYFFITSFLHCNALISVLQEITKELYFITFQEEVQFPCKVSGPLFRWFACIDISMACIARTDNHQVKGLEKNYMPMH